MDRVWAAFDDAPLLVRCWLAGAFALGGLGGVAGFGIGMAANPSTAWFAVLEVGVPAAFLGALLGLIVGLVLKAMRPDGPRQP